MDDRPVSSPSVNKSTRKFAPSVRGSRGGASARGRGGRSAPSSSSSTAEAGTANTAQEAAPPAPPASPSRPIGSLRPESGQEGRLGSVHDSNRTRGGAAKMKFKPTVPAKRNKKEVVKPSSIDERLKEQQGRGGRGGRGGGRGRGRGRGRDIIVEASASGFFSLGPSAMSQRSRMAGTGSFATFGGDAYGAERGESSAQSDMQTMFEGAVDGATPVVFPHVARTAGELDPSDLSTQRQKIPWLRASEDQAPLSKPKSEDKKMPRVKRESGDMDQDDDAAAHSEWLMNEDAPAQNVFGVTRDNQVASIADEEFLFFQLPSTLPQFEKEQEDQDVEMKTEDGTKGKGKQPEKEQEQQPPQQLPEAAKADSLENKMKALELNEVESGQIGTLVVLKSGKMKLRIGDILLDVQQGMRSTFLEDVMVVDAESSQNKKIVELGHIVQKFVCMPDMDSLLNE